MEQSYCNGCIRSTNHKVLEKHTVSDRGEYSCDFEYQIVKCLGCDRVSFRQVFTDIEAGYPVGDDEWEFPQTVNCFPSSLQGHKALDDIWEVPTLVCEIYNELLVALKEDAPILAGLGLRGTVEAVCNDLGIKGANLSVRINKLATAGYISKSDAERLHAIRFMGNDAAHEIKKPKRESLSVALKIIEHMLVSVYILEKQADGYLETVTSKYEVFEKILVDKLDDYSPGDEYPIAKFVGRDLRRINDSIASLETELISRINHGQFNRLGVGKVDNFNGSASKLQHYIVI